VVNAAADLSSKIMQQLEINGDTLPLHRGQHRRQGELKVIVEPVKRMLLKAGSELLLQGEKAGGTGGQEAAALLHG